MAKWRSACFVRVLQEEQNRGKPNWEHLNDELHVLITVEDTENRALVKLQRAVDEIKKLLFPAVSSSYLYSYWLFDAHWNRMLFLLLLLWLTRFAGLQQA